MRIYLSMIMILFAMTAMANNCHEFNGSWHSALGDLQICQGKLQTKTNIWSIHSVLCYQDNLRIISSNGSKIIITSHPPLKRETGDALTLYNGRDSIALYYQGDTCAS